MHGIPVKKSEKNNDGNDEMADKLKMALKRQQANSAGDGDEESDAQKEVRSSKSNRNKGFYHLTNLAELDEHISNNILTYS